MNKKSLNSEDTSMINADFKIIDNVNDVLEKRLILLQLNNNFHPYYSFVSEKGLEILNICYPILLNLEKFIEAQKNTPGRMLYQSKIDVEIEPIKPVLTGDHNDYPGCILFSDAKMSIQLISDSEHVGGYYPLDNNKKYHLYGDSYCYDWKIQAEDGKFALIVHTREKISINLQVS